MSKNIGGLILDVDGVIIGEKPGFNFPDPNPKVIERLKSIRNNGLPVTLCTAKPLNAIQKIISWADLHNLHITQGGGVIIDPIDNKILKVHAINNDAARQVCKICLDRNVYIEFYTANDYYIQSSQRSELTDLHTKILLGFKPKVVDSLISELNNAKVVKLMPISKDDRDMQMLDKLFAPYRSDLTISWGSHPVALPRRFGIITANGISKEQAVSEIAEYENIESSKLLGIGDSTSDWQFMQHCGYVGTVDNASDELKKLLSMKGDRGFMGGSVDENGVLDVLDHFEIM